MYEQYLHLFEIRQYECDCILSLNCIRYFSPSILGHWFDEYRWNWNTSTLRAIYIGPIQIANCIWTSSILCCCERVMCVPFRDNSTSERMRTHTHPFHAFTMWMRAHMNTLLERTIARDAAAVRWSHFGNQLSVCMLLCVCGAASVCLVCPSYTRAY